MPTIGVSIALPEPWGRQLQHYRLSLGDDSARQIPSHITLVPPTSIPDDSYADIADHLRAVAADHAPFEVHLRGTGTFRPVSPVVFIALARGISECELLAADLRAGPLSQETEFPYHPHVTIAHHVDETTMERAFIDMAGFDCTFEVPSLWLYTFDASLGWVKSAEFRLG